RREATRSRERPAARVRYRDLLLDPETCELWIDRRAVALTVTEFTTLVALLRAQGAVLSRTELLDRAWGGDHLDVGERAVDNVILRLRRKLGRPELIQTVRGVGFRIGTDDEPVRGDGSDAEAAAR
ncbi:MAG TPA: winged helix-turn-helix domain-containing protein, partial [Kofleriaceae bacterium]|nr:winged helix-turn-helix domain-containing protein [Kofleriaceae bacterium]